MSPAPRVAGRALVAHAQQSQRDTRRKLELAVHRLMHDNPLVVPKGTKVTAVSVAKEAGIDRATLYRFHEPVLKEIRSLSDSAPESELRSRKARRNEAETRLREYRTLVEQAQAEVTALARINYRLQARVDDLEASLRVRDERITALKREVNRALG
ncbi:hypothetical protein [Acidiphilium sp.]|uniref:hypothetical protein n=1 Tax=Acidiphilium sp. TaxID=527 RepID=UPI00258AB194|nr:hypothetical protein [Acidiphilium sp.]